MPPGEVLILIWLEIRSELKVGDSAVDHIQHMQCERMDQSEALRRQGRRRGCHQPFLIDRILQTHRLRHL